MLHVSPLALSTGRKSNQDLSSREWNQAFAQDGMVTCANARARHRIFLFQAVRARALQTVAKVG